MCLWGDINGLTTVYKYLYISFDSTPDRSPDPSRPKKLNTMLFIIPVLVTLVAANPWPVPQNREGPFDICQLNCGFEEPSCPGENSVSNRRPTTIFARVFSADNVLSVVRKEEWRKLSF